MRRKKLVKRFEGNGWYLLRHGGRHDVYMDGKNLEVIPRHSEIDEMLAGSLIRKWKL